MSLQNQGLTPDEVTVVGGKKSAFQQEETMRRTKLVWRWEPTVS